MGSSQVRLFSLPDVVSVLVPVLIQSRLKSATAVYGVCVCSISSLGGNSIAGIRPGPSEPELLLFNGIAHILGLGAPFSKRAGAHKICLRRYLGQDDLSCVQLAVKVAVEEQEE